MQAKKDLAQQIAVASGMEYRILKSADADKRHNRPLLVLDFIANNLR